MIERWITFKMDKEYYEVRNRPHPYEMELYFDA
jgi:glutamine synthetase